MIRPLTRDHPAVLTSDAGRDGGSSGLTRFCIDIRRHLGTVEITVGGDVDALGCELLTGALSDLVDGQGNLDVMVDLAAVVHIESAALEAIAAAAHTNARRGGRVRIKATMNPVLTAAGLDSLLIAPQRCLAIDS